MSHMALGFTIFMLSREYKIIVLAFLQNEVTASIMLANQEDEDNNKKLQVI